MNSTAPIAIDSLDATNFLDIDMESETLRQNAMNGMLAEWAVRKPFYARRNGLAVAVCARAKDVREVYTHPEIFTVIAPPYDAYKVFDIFGGLESVLQMDGERHARVRRLMTPAFMPSGVQQLENAIDTIIKEKLDNIAAMGAEFDVMEHFSRDIIVRVLLEASFKLTPEQQEVFSRMHNSMGLATEFEPDKPLPEEFINTVVAVRKVIDEIVAERRKNPGDDMISHLVMARDEGRGLNDEELFGQINSICAAGLGTTAATIGGALYILGKHPEQLDLLKREPQLVDIAVEECLRYHGPGINTFTRFTTQDTELGGVFIPKDMPVIASIQAASYDPEEFADPLRFDIRRSPRAILAFGSGPHFCIGNRLARLIMRKAILKLITRFPNLRLADPNFKPVYTGFPGELCLTKLPMRID
ncbi:MAG: hypothetical protein JWM78_2627 [Verrucomicrobiaceae bacterium]|nr:hypothetical protein [Verrucomicrobiaceae bacterium]